MHLIYLDESGNTGLRLDDADQPVFVLCAMVVAEDRWQSLEAGLRSVLDEKIPTWRNDPNFEIHASHLRSARGFFSRMTAVGDRIAVRDAWMNVGIDHGVKLISRSVNKKRYAAWLTRAFGAGISVHPYVASFALLSRCVDNYLASLGGRPRGLLIADENKEIAADIEKSSRIFRETTGPLRYSQIIEKVFFIESHKSLPLQLCDLFSMSIRKGIEARVPAATPKPIDATGIELANSIAVEDHQHDGDVLDWLVREHTPPSS